MPAKSRFVDEIVPQLNFPPIADDVCDYFSITMDELRELYDRHEIGAHNQSLYDKWQSLEPDPEDPSDVAEIYETSEWGYVLEQAFIDRASFGKFERCRPYVRGESLLDYGAASGQLLLYFDQFDNLDLTGADLASPHFDLAQYRFQQHAPTIEAIEIDPENPPVGDWDTIVCLDVLEHVPNWISVLEAMSASQEEGNRLIVETCFGHGGEDSLHIQQHTDLTPDTFLPQLERLHYEIIENDGDEFLVGEKRE